MRPEDSIGYLIRRTGRAMRNLIHQRLKEDGLQITMEQGAVLMKLNEKDGCSQNDLAGFLSKDKTTVARLLANMEKSGLLSRKEGLEDKRVKTVHLSPEGAKLRGKLKGIIMSTLGEITEGVEPEELMLFKGVLNKIYNNINPLDEDLGICD